MISVLGRNEIKLHQLHLGKKEPLEEVIEPRLGKLEPILGIFEPRLGISELRLGRIKPLLGITKPVVGLNRLYLGKFRRARNSAAGEVKTPLTDQTSTKAVAFLYEQSYGSGSNPFENYVSVDFTKSFNRNMTGIDVGPSLDLSARDRDRYSKIAKRMKRRREREPSRLSVRKILRSMKKRKTILKGYL